jgi:hypothetical protein
MLHHPTSKKLIERLKHSLDNEKKELIEWKQKLVYAQKYEDAGVVDHILKELETLLSNIDKVLDDGE